MKTILVALDGSSRAGGVLEAAASLAGRLDAKLVLVRATGIPGELPLEAYVADPDDVARVLAERALNDLDVLAQAIPRRLVASMRAEAGPPHEVIESVARSENVDLVVIGAHGYGTLERFLGTTASKVVNRADRPVLVVRDPSRLVS